MAEKMSRLFVPKKIACVSLSAVAVSPTPSLDLILRGDDSHQFGIGQGGKLHLQKLHAG
jgi:hypothetical protein